jgi:hypothetical protein
VATVVGNTGRQRLCGAIVPDSPTRASVIRGEGATREGTGKDASNRGFQNGHENQFSVSTFRV